MDTKGNKDNPIGAETPKGDLQRSGQEGDTQKPVIQISADTFVDKLVNKLSSAVGRPQNGSPEIDAQQAKRFESYSQAFAGFAQNNVSKSEGFSLGVDFKSQKTKEEYDKLTEKLIKEKKLIDQLPKY